MDRPLGKERIILVTTPEVVADLDALVATGLFGRDRWEAAEELLRAALREAVRAGWLERARRPSSAGPRRAGRRAATRRPG